MLPRSHQGDRDRGLKRVLEFLKLEVDGAARAPSQHGACRRLPRQLQEMESVWGISRLVSVHAGEGGVSEAEGPNMTGRGS